MEKDLKIKQFTFYFSKAINLSKDLCSFDTDPSLQVTLFEKIKIFKSIKLYSKCLTLVPNQWQCLYYLGKLYQRLKDHTRALHYFESAFKVEKKEFIILQEASLEASSLKKYDLAVFFSEEALKFEPNDAALLGNHALHLFHGGFIKESKLVIGKAIEINPNDNINLQIKARIFEEDKH